MRELECVVCGAELVPAEDPPHCVDCYVSEEDRGRWEDAMSEARSEHEWTHNGRRFLVRWLDEQWTLAAVAFTTPPLRINLHGDSDSACAAEIAKLAGLVPPGGEEEK